MRWRLDVCSDLGAEPLYPYGDQQQHGGHLSGYSWVFHLGESTRKTDNRGQKVILAALPTGERRSLPSLKGPCAGHHSIHNSNYESLL